MVFRSTAEQVESTVVFLFHFRSSADEFSSVSFPVPPAPEGTSVLGIFFICFNQPGGSNSSVTPAVK